MAWTIAQAADFLQLRPKSLRAMAHNGIVPATKPGKAWIFDEDTLREWLQNKTRENLRPCPSLSVPNLRIGKSSSSSLESRLMETLEQKKKHLVTP